MNVYLLQMAKCLNSEENAFLFMERLIREVSVPGETTVTLRSSFWYEESRPVDVIAWIKEIGFTKWAKLCSNAWSFFVDMPAGIICRDIDDRHKNCSTNCIDFGEAPKDETPFVRIVMIDGDPKIFKLQKLQNKILPQLLQINTKLPIGTISKRSIFDAVINNSK